MKKTTKITFAALAATALANNASATEISTDTAVMQAMDKITGQVSLIEVPINSEVKFGTFSILAHECKTRPPEETPENFAFIDVVDDTANGPVNIFKGWMISSSPALNPVAHPVYDVWLLKCTNKGKSEQPKMTEEELQARDEIVMNRSNYPETPPEPVNEEDFEQRTPGEPMNLIPDEVGQANLEEDKTDTEKQENSAPDTQTQNAEQAPAPVAENVGEQPAPAEQKPVVAQEKSEDTEGQPEALLSVSQAVEVAVPQIEATVQESDYESLEELPQAENTAEPEKVAEPEKKVEPQPETAVKEPEKVAEPEKKVEPQPETAVKEPEKVAEPEKKVEPQPETAVKEPEKPQESIDERILKLEQELSAKAIEQ